jgi:hypothetical protein
MRTNLTVWIAALTFMAIPAPAQTQTPVVLDRDGACADPSQGGVRSDPVESPLWQPG